MDEANLLHIGDAHKAPLDVEPDILCLPWRVPSLYFLYKKRTNRTAKHFHVPYIIQFIMICPLPRLEHPI